MFCHPRRTSCVWQTGFISHERLPASLLTWCTDRECSVLQPALMPLCSHCNTDCEQSQWLLRSTWVHPCWCWLSCSAKLLQSWNARVADVFGYLRKGAWPAISLGLQPVSQNSDSHASFRRINYEWAEVQGCLLYLILSALRLLFDHQDLHFLITSAEGRSISY